MGRTCRKRVSILHALSAWLTFHRGRYWSHRCNPLAVPSNGTSIKLACQPRRDNVTNAFQCYISQVHAAWANNVYSTKDHQSPHMHNILKNQLSGSCASQRIGEQFRGARHNKQDIPSHEVTLPRHCT